MPSREEVLETARLARLALTTGEIDRMQHELDGILNHIDALRQVAASDAAEAERSADEHAAADTAAAADEAQGSAAADDSDDAAPLRADVPGPDPLSMPPSYFAAEWRDGFFTVPRLPGHD